MQCNRSFTETFNDVPEKLLSPLDYFNKFFPDSLLETVVDQTNLYSVQKSLKSVDTNVDEMTTLIGMEILMGVIKLPSHRNYWSRSLRFPTIADAMPRIRFELLRRYIHFVDQDTKHDANDGLFKIKPILEAVRKECVKVETEEFHSVDEQIIQSKTRYTKVRQYNPKKPRKWGFRNLVWAGASGFMYDVFLYGGKESNEVTPYSHLQKSAQVVAKLCVELPRHVGRKVFVDNWFTTLDLMIYLKKEGLLAVGTIRSNCLQGCP